MSVVRLDKPPPEGLPPTWEAARIEDHSKGIGVGLHRLTHAELARWGRDPKLLHVAAWFDRPGAVDWLHALEWTYFPPATPLNDRFQCHWVRWEEILWVVATIPMKVRRFAERSADRLGFRLADGVPTIVEMGEDGRPKPTWFPMRGDNVFTLEWVPDSPHYASVNDPAGRAAIVAGYRRESERRQERSKDAHRRN